jgi:cell division protein FtsL
MKSFNDREHRISLGTQRLSGALRKRYQQHPVFLNMGPVAVCVASVLLIGLMAILYLSQVGQAVDANRRLEQIRHEQSSLTRQNQDLTEQLAEAQSPAYIARHAQQQGLQPADPKNVHPVVVENLQPKSDQRQP